MLLFIVEVLAFLATIILAVLWIRSPGGNYEPWTVICGAVAGGIEIYRRVRSPRKKPPSEQLVKLLQDRAELVQERIEKRRRSLLAAPRVGAGLPSNRSRADNLRELKEQFRKWHGKHIDAIRRGDYVRAHEFNRTIQEILLEVNEEFQSPIGPPAFYATIWMIFESVLGLYPGSRPEDVSPEDSAAANLIWPDELAADSAEFTPPVTLDFDASSEKCVQLGRRFKTISGGTMEYDEYRYAIGVRNLSAKQFANCRLVLDSAEPHHTSQQRLEVPMNVRGIESPNGIFTLSSSDGAPTVYVEILQELVPRVNPLHQHSTIQLTYANEVSGRENPFTEPELSAEWTLGFRLEGEFGKPERIYVSVKSDGNRMGGSYIVRKVD